VIGGLVPVTKSTITLYAVGDSYATGASVLGRSTTENNVDFSISVNCPAGNPETYITAVGGDAGKGSNAAIGLIVLSGPCQSLAGSTVVINELSTVAAEWALSQFTDPSGQIVGAPGSNSAGLHNSFDLARTNLVNTSTGTPSSFWPVAKFSASI